MQKKLWLSHGLQLVSGTLSPIPATGTRFSRGDLEGHQTLGLVRYRNTSSMVPDPAGHHRYVDGSSQSELSACN